MWPGRINRCNLDDYSLLAIMEFLNSARKIEELELQIYGNSFTAEVLVVLLDCVANLQLRKFTLSVFEFVNQENDPKFSHLLRKFEELEIGNKRLA